MHKHTGHKYPGIATDAIIEYRDEHQEGIVLIERMYPPLGFALPGGKAEIGITLEQNACKEVLEETGLRFEHYNAEQPLCVHSSPDRDPREHMISITYIGKGTGRLRAGDDAKNAKIFTIDEVKQLIAKGQLCFDHSRALVKYLRKTGEKNTACRQGAT